MKAAVLNGLEDLVITRVPDPVCNRGEVLVKVEACGLCRTDMKAFYHGQRDLRLPRILGHEIAGRVVEAAVEPGLFEAGDRVQIAPGLPCGTCHYCLRGWDHLCQSVQIIGFHCDGGLGEYVLIPARAVSNQVLNRIPDQLSNNEAVFTEPLACSINMQESIQVRPGDVVLIYGAGPLGILNARLARNRGAERIVLLEIDDRRIAGLEPSDYDCILNPERDDIKKAIMDISGGLGASVVIPCCPAPETLKSGFEVLAKRGRLGFFSGLIWENGTPEFDVNLIHYKEITVQGGYGCSTRHNREALRLLAGREVPVNDLVSRVIDLEEVRLALAMIKERRERKIVVNF